MKKRHTFTLVEILTTIAILAILAGISLGVTKLAFGKAHESKNQALIKMIEVALEQYKSKYGYYPNSGDKPRLFTMDMVDLTLAAGESDNDKKTRVLTNNIWQYFDEDFKKTFVKQIPVDNNIFYGYVIDAKGNPLIYRCPGIFNTGSFDLGSVGEDGYIGDKVTPVNQATKLEAINDTDYEKFGQGDDIVNFTNNEQ
ncbi:MAG: prepilin-type N-terminal cleavage/methylation domain-containing protein [Victivallales bacterium]